MRWFTIGILSLAACFATAARGDIYQWEYIDPLHPELGRQQSSTLAPDGAGRDAVPAADLRSLDLTMAWFQKADLNGADFRGCFLPNVDLSAANLADALFAGAYLGDADLSGANLNSASFYNDRSGTAVLTGANLSGADVRGASFYSFTDTMDSGFTATQLYSTASYQAGDLSGISLTGDLTGWNFAGQNLTDVNLQSAILTNADFTNAIIRGGRFTDTTDSGFTATQLYSTASYQAGDLEGIWLTNNDLTSWDFSGKNLTDARFEVSTLTDADLSGADLTNASFSTAPINGADFTGAEVRGASFRSIGFTAAQLYSTASYQAGDLTGIDLSYNDLTGWNFAAQNLANTDFWLTTLTDADFTGAEIHRASFSATTDSGFNAAQLYSTASYQAGDLSGIGLGYNDLTGWNFAGQNLTGAFLWDATLTDADLTGANLTRAILSGAVTGADFTGAEVRGAYFSGTTGFTAAQLYSTASYQKGDLSGIGFGSLDLTGWNLSGLNLSQAKFQVTQLTNLDLRDANLTEARFDAFTMTNADLSGANLECAKFEGYHQSSIASTDMHNSTLRGAFFGVRTITETNLAGANLSSAAFYYAEHLINIDFSGVNLQAGVIAPEGPTDYRGLDFTGADTRGAYPNLFVFVESYDPSESRNFIDSSGRVAGLHVLAGETLRLWDLDPMIRLNQVLLDDAEIPLDDPLRDPIGDIPILVEEAMSIDPGGTLRIIFEDDQWGSMITFEPGILVAFDGTLELLFDDDANPIGLVGTTFQLFNWTGVSPEGQFEMILTQNGLLWNTGHLYTTGEVTLIGVVPEPASVVLLALFSMAMMCRYRLVSAKSGR